MVKVKAPVSAALAQPAIVKSVMPVNRLPVVLDIAAVAKVAPRRASAACTPAASGSGTVTPWPT